MFLCTPHGCQFPCKLFSLHLRGRHTSSLLQMLAGSMTFTIIHFAVHKNIHYGPLMTSLVQYRFTNNQNCLKSFKQNELQTPPPLKKNNNKKKRMHKQKNGSFGVTIKIILSTLTEPVIYDTSNIFLGLCLLWVRENQFQ